MKIIAAVVITMITTAVAGEIYKVGGYDGWTNVDHVDYMAWASTKTFRVGDKIVFRYNKGFQNVVRVTYNNFKTCNGTAPFDTFTSGNDTFPIMYPGHYYFICTVPRHCEGGQKVDIRVPPAKATPAGSLAPIQPLPFPYPPPSPVSPPPSKTPASSPLPTPSQSPPKDAPSLTPPVSAPEIVPSPPPKNGASQLSIGFKLWTPIIAGFIYLVGFSF